MFRPNQKGQLSRSDGYDRYGQPIRSTPVDVDFAVVRAPVQSARTSVRTDASASGGSSDEMTTHNAKILVPGSSQVKIGDRFDFSGDAFLISSVEQRRNVFGAIDHIECELELLP